MKLKDFTPLIGPFHKALSSKVRERDPDAQVAIKTGSCSSIYNINIISDYGDESYILWLGSDGKPYWCQDRSIFRGFR